MQSNPPRILWLASGILHHTPEGPASNVASVRLRCLIPATLLKNAGMAIDIQALHEIAALPQADVAVFGKAATPASVHIATHAKRQGARIVFDVCDDHFTDSPYAPFFNELAALADALTCNTEAMAEVARRFTSAPVHVIDDPFESPERPARFAPGPALKLCWFGHPTNLKTLAAVSSLTGLNASLHVVTELSPGAQDMLNTIAAQGIFSELKATPWSLPAQHAALDECDLAIIPSLPGPKTQVKSSNRLVETLRAGRFAVAHPLPAYQALADYAWVGENLREGIAWSLAHPQEAEQRIAQGQRHITETLSPEVIAGAWKEIFASVYQ